VPQVFRPQADQIVRIGLFALLAAVLIIPIAWAAYDRSPYSTGQFVPYDQPVPFSHAHHVGEIGLDCRYCHQGVETSASAGLPATEVCMTCHSQILSDAPILAPVRESFATGTPIQWRRVHDLPDFVFFNHAAHVRNGVGCETCHGRVDQMQLTMQSAPLTMEWCLGCHRDPGPNLRPESAEYQMDWKPQGDDRKRGEALIAHYHVHPEALTDCYVCHR
jgi:hypothetical protein